MKIIYRELSSLEKDIGVSARALYTLSYRRDRHYRTVFVPKGNGEKRELHVPDKFLKTVQKRIAETILFDEPVSVYAKAYRKGGSVFENAKEHIGKPFLLKLDIRHFFDHIIYPIVKEKVFSAERFSEQNRILLSVLCVYKDALPQGAPSSPVISNIIMRDFDDAVGKWCSKRNISYTRYCDDMTFSGEFDSSEVIDFVKKELWKMRFYLNGKKTVLLKKGQRMKVTGVIVNEKLNVSKDYRKKLRQELYYCRKFGIAEHLERNKIAAEPEKYAKKLFGKVNFVLQADPENEEMKEYRNWLKERF